MNRLKLLLLVLNTVYLLVIPSISTASHAAIIIDANNGAVLHEINATHAWYPASLTKLMTLYMTFDALKSGQLQLSESMVASSHAARQPNSKLGLRHGEYITVENAILALITRSANDASVVLAERIGGSEENFASQMTAKAHGLGMYNSQFMNATGLPNNWQITTPRDMALLALKTLHHFPEFYHYFSAHSVHFRGTELPAINKFTNKYPGAEGMKTGFTCGSGFNLIGSAQQNGKRLIGVVMGGMTSQERYQLMMQKMDAGFANAVSDPARNVQTMSTGSAGTPPYQLDCGNGGSSAGSETAYKPLPSKRSLHNSRHKHVTPTLTRTKFAKTSRSNTKRNVPRVTKAPISKSLYKKASTVKPSAKKIIPKQATAPKRITRPSSKVVNTTHAKSQTTAVKSAHKHQK